MDTHRLLTGTMPRLGVAAIAALLCATGAPGPAPLARAAGIVVNTLADANPPVVDGQCSLREAILNANANAALSPDCAAGAGADTITFSVSGNINLALRLNDVTDPAGLLIDGTGQNVHLRGGGFGAQFNVAAGAVAEVKELTFELNPAGIDTDRSGGGINNAGALTLNRVTVQGNVADRGAGIFSTGTLTLRDSTVSGNSGDSRGGGLWNSGTLVVASSTISGNSGSNVQGAGIWNQGSAAMVNSTVSGNSASDSLAVVPAVPEDPAPGAGIYNIDGGSFVIASSTITNNRVGYCIGLCSSGPAGILNAPNATGLALINTIVAGNEAVGAGDWDCDRDIEVIGPNLIGTLFKCTTFGSTPMTGKPYLGPLASNGGPTQTHALLAPSLAISSGDPARCAAPPVNGVDQRGVARPQGSACDLGAFESDLPAAPGGRNLRIITGSIDLSWDTGIAQTGYQLLRYNTSTTAATLIPLAGTATNYSDTSAVDDTVYCYVLAATGPGGAFLGLSDLLCGMTGPESATVVPQDFALTLGGTTSATLTWAPPVGGVTSYLLQRIPLDGSAPSHVLLGQGVTETTQTVSAAGSCFQLIAFLGASFGGTNLLCGVPGISSVGAPAGAKVASLQDAQAVLRERLAGLTLPALERVRP